MSNFGKALLYYREKRELTHNDLAILSGIQQSYIAFLESGRDLPSHDKLAKVIAGLELNEFEAMDIYKNYLEDRPEMLSELLVDIAENDNYGLYKPFLSLTNIKNIPGRYRQSIMFFTFDALDTITESLSDNSLDASSKNTMRFEILKDCLEKNIPVLKFKKSLFSPVDVTEKYKKLRAEKDLDSDFESVSKLTDLLEPKDFTTVRCNNIFCKLTNLSKDKTDFILYVGGKYYEVTINLLEIAETYRKICSDNPGVVLLNRYTKLIKYITESETSEMNKNLIALLEKNLDIAELVLKTVNK